MNQESRNKNKNENARIEQEQEQEQEPPPKPPTAVPDTSEERKKKHNFPLLKTLLTLWCSRTQLTPGEGKKQTANLELYYQRCFLLVSLFSSSSSSRQGRTHAAPCSIQPEKTGGIRTIKRYDTTGHIIIIIIIDFLAPTEKGKEGVSEGQPSQP